MDRYTAIGGEIYEQTWVNPERAATLLNELAAANDRIAELEYNGSHDRLRATQRLVDELREKLEATQTPARIRFNVTAADFQAAWEHPKEQRTWPEFAMEYLADHAVIDVPPGVPSVKELGRISAAAVSDIEAAIAVRDAVLAGVAQPEPPADLVEALAKVIRQARMEAIECGPDKEWDDLGLRTKDIWRAEARAAIAFLRPVTWQDVKKQMSDIRTPSLDDYSRLMDWLRSVLPGGEE